jgi:hypothetical protein
MDGGKPVKKKSFILDGDNNDSKSDSRIGSNTEKERGPLCLA